MQYILQVRLVPAAGSIDFPYKDSAKWGFSAEVTGLVAAEVDQRATLDQDDLGGTCRGGPEKCFPSVKCQVLVM